MELLHRLDLFFNKYHKAITKEQLISMLDLKKDDEKCLVDGLYQLQKLGKIYLDEYGNYIKVSKDFYLKFGEVQLSKKGKYYIKVDKMQINLLENDKIKKGDFVFVEVLDNSKAFQHKKYYEGKVKKIVERSNKDNFQKYLVKGIIHLSGHHMYFLKHDNDFFVIRKNDLGTAYPGDVVTAEVVIKGKVKYAKVKEVLTRKRNVQLYEYCYYQGGLQWVPVGRNYYKVELLTDVVAMEHDRILAEIKEENGVVYLDNISKVNYNQENPYDVASDVIGHYGFYKNFSSNALREAQALKLEDISNRVDYTNLVTVTIDGESAKDFDDAISIERLSNGNYMLYVHIADVSYYVKNGMHLWDEAYERGTSVYLGNQVFPMFPKELSNDLCSLNPHEKKVTKTCRMEIDCYGTVVDFEIVNSIIESNMRMIYDDVDMFFECGIVREGYDKFIKELTLMKELSQILQKRKLKQGYTYFYSDELVFLFDKDGNPIGREIDKHSISKEIIENFMLIANETVAGYLYFLDVPTIFRNHEAPKKYRLDEVVKVLKGLGYWNKDIRVDDPYCVQKLLKRYRNKKEFPYLSDLILKAMTKAYYSSKCCGHYGLGIPRYTHFTSPIRRYPDFIVHESLNNVWNGEFYQWSDLDKAKYKEVLEKRAIHLSNQEIASRDAEREYDCYLLDLYVRQLMNREMDAEIVFLDKENIYIRTKDFIEGVLCHHGVYDRKKREVLIGDNTYYVGDTLFVMLSGYSKELGCYLFEFVENSKKLVKR